MRSSFKMTLFTVGLVTALAVGAQSAAEPRPIDAPPYPPDGCVRSEGGSRSARGLHGMTPEQHRARFDADMVQQAQALQITATQRPQWDAYVQARKAIFDDVSSRHNKPQDFAKMTPDQRAEWHAQRMETGARHMRGIAGSIKALRGVLTAEQRARFDQRDMTMAPHGKKEKHSGLMARPDMTGKAPLRGASAQR